MLWKRGKIKRSVIFGGCSSTSAPPYALRSLFPSLLRGEISTTAQGHWKVPDIGGKLQKRVIKARRGPASWSCYSSSLIKALFLLILFYFFLILWFARCRGISGGDLMRTCRLHLTFTSIFHETSCCTTHPLPSCPSQWGNNTHHNRIWKATVVTATK